MSFTSHQSSPKFKFFLFFFSFLFFVLFFIKKKKKKQIVRKKQTKALIGPLGYAGWCARLLFANPKDRVSRVEAHIRITVLKHNA